MVYPLFGGLHEDKGFETFPLWRVNIRHFFPISDTPALPSFVPSNLTWVYLSHTTALVRDLSLATEHLSTHRTNTWPVFCQTRKSFRSDYSNRRSCHSLTMTLLSVLASMHSVSTGSRRSSLLLTEWTKSQVRYQAVPLTFPLTIQRKGHPINV